MVILPIVNGILLPYVWSDFFIFKLYSTFIIFFYGRPAFRPSKSGDSISKLTFVQTTEG